jgi:hypothetical protein
MNTQIFIDDIPCDVARHASAGISFDPEKRGNMAITEYASTLAGDYETLSSHAPTDEMRAILDTEFARYRAGYKVRTLAYLRSKSRCVSPMIAGPSRFPVQRMEKHYRVCDRRMRELCEYRQRALEAIRKTLHPEWRPIMAGDGDALDRLGQEVADLEKQIARMKLANAAIRRSAKEGKEARIAAILAVDPAFTPESAARLVEPDCMGCIGFAAYLFRNCGAELRRLRSRLAIVARSKATPETILEGDNKVRLEDCPSDNRVRLFFPGKPDEAIRTRLKANGFRWTPSLGCWQAYRNSRSLAHAKQLVTPPELAAQ